MLTETQEDLNKICERCIRIIFRRTFGITTARINALNKSLTKFAYIISRTERRWKQNVEIFIFDQNKFLLFLLEEHEGFQFLKMSSIDSTFLTKVKKRVTLQKRDPEMFESVSRYAYSGGLFNAIGSFYYFPTE